MSSNSIRALLLASTTALSACAAPADHGGVDLKLLARRHDAAARDFRAAKGLVEASTPVPQTVDLGPDGSVRLNDVRLVGRPERAFLSVHFTYVNSTNAPIDAVNTTLVVRDLERGVEWDQEWELRFPYGRRIGPDCTYTYWFEIPTYGVHRGDDWEWDLVVEAVSGEPATP